MKSYTDLDQSKKLAEILPLESADMCYSNDGTAIKIDANPYTVRYSMWKDCVAEIIPCWSLAALISILPNNKHITTTLSRGGWKIEPIEYIDIWWCKYEDDSHTKDFSVSASNPIDACVVMIEKLHELKML